MSHVSNRQADETNSGAPVLQRSKYPYRNGIKRLLDVCVVLLMLPVVLPIVLFMALLVATDGASPFYRQARVGRGGRAFSMWKMRSMVVGADAALQRHLASDPAAKAEWDLNQKLKHDPRITRIGRILRKTSMDELPQLWNVLRGDMSLVGPRPMMVDQQPLYPGKAYFRLRPGITGNWQVSKRHESEFTARAVYDAAYEAELTLKTDARILWQTVGVVLRAKGC